MLGIRANEVNSEDIRNGRIEEEKDIESTTDAARDSIDEIIDDEDYDKQDIKRSKRSKIENKHYGNKQSDSNDEDDEDYKKQENKRLKQSKIEYKNSDGESFTSSESDSNDESWHE